MRRVPLNRGERGSANNITGSKSVPAPVGGLNARDSLANMPETDAVILENFFPTPSSVDSRLGYRSWATGLPAWVETLATYNGTSSKKMFAVSDGKIYDVTTQGAVGAAAVSGLTNSRHQFVNFSTLGGHYMYLVNGADKPQIYDGSAWTAVDGASTPAITGVTTTNLISVNSFKNRLWFIEKNSTKIWYLPVNSIGGAATKIDFGPLFKLGGYLMAMATWSIDNAAGVDDYAAFISSEGEVLTYKGIDPDFSSTWALAAQFRVGRPIGRRCTARVGSDVLVICADGLFPLSKALLTDRSQVQDAISNKITNLINNDVQQYNANFGWQVLLYPIGNKLYVNVPRVENSVQYQYVMNTITGAWTKFTGMNAACWELLNDSVYFGGSGTVYQADYGYTDNTAAITLKGKPAFSYFGNKGRQKQFTLIRPIFLSQGKVSAAIQINTDFQDVAPTATPTYSGTTGSLWDVSYWTTPTYWGGLNNLLKSWQAGRGVGFCATVNMVLQVKGVGVQWQSTDYVYQMGGTL